MKVIKILQDENQETLEEKLHPIYELITLNHENIVPVSEVMFEDDDKSKKIGYAMNLYWMGDLYEMITALNLSS